MKNLGNKLKACLWLLLCTAAVQAQPARPADGGAPEKTVWYNPAADSLLPIQGRCWNRETGPVYQRLPQRAARLVRQPVWNLSRQTAGLYIQFRTNAPRIEVKYTVTGGHAMPHMPATGVSGVDLYMTDCDGRTHWCAAKYQFGDTIRYTYRDLTYRNTHAKGNEFTLYLPLYNGVKTLEIGVPDGSPLLFQRPSAEKPVIVYGTSIAQGACASRPGMAWTNILQRKLDRPVVNLGFSGNGQLDEAMFQLLAETDAALYVIDCMPNMTDERADLIRPRLEKGLRLLRSRSSAPILLVEHDGYMGYTASASREEQFRRTNRELRRAYDSLNAELGGLHYLGFEELGLSMDSQVDGVHATDLGMAQYAEAYYNKVSQILYGGEPATHFTPCRQHRDADTYRWNERHEQVLRHVAACPPQIVLLGNSITHFWGGEPYEKRRVAPDVWDKLFRGRRAANLGFGWDRIENALWRIRHGELDGYRAEKVFLLLGTNNLTLNSDDEIVLGLQETVAAVAAKQPDARIYVVRILPRRGYEERLARLNDRIADALQASPRTEVIDPGHVLLSRDGRIDEGLFSDGLHPNHEGYRRLARELEPYVR